MSDPTPVTAMPSLAAKTPATAVALAPGTSFGAYRIEGRLGEGGMGVVYRAVHTTLGRPVALKVMRAEFASDREFAERFLREARTAAAISHPNVVAIHDAGELDGRLFMAFELVAGGDLASLLDRRGAALPWNEALRLIDHCAAGIEALAKAGLVHRDLKPTNVFLAEDGRAKLGDFGLARSATGDDRMTNTGVGMGTPSYMSPEQAHGLGDIDQRSDLHALGGTLFTLLTRKPPYEGATAWVVVNKVCNDPPPDPRELNPAVPAGVAALVQTLMAKERAERPQTATEVRVMVATLLAGDQQATLALPGVLPNTSESTQMPATISGAAVLPPSRSERALGRYAAAWRMMPLPLTVLLSLLPLLLCPLIGIERAGAWPWDEPGFWLLVLPTTAAWQALLWLPLRRLALAGRHGLPPLTVGERWPGVIAGAVLMGAAAALTLGALCELFRWRADAWIMVQLVLGAAIAVAWLWAWARHRLSGDPRAHHARHLIRLSEGVGGAAALTVLCLLLLTLREPTVVTPPEAAKPETAKSEPTVRSAATGFWSQLRDTFRDGRAGRETKEPGTPRQAATSAPAVTHGYLLIHSPAAAGTGILSGLVLAVLLPGVLTLAARRRERAVGTPAA